MSIDKLKTVYSTGAWLPNVKTFFKKINEIIDWINNIGSTTTPVYKEYTALISQTGTNAPISNILNNTLEGTPIWTRFNVGTYKLTLNDTFTINKTFLPSFGGYFDVAGTYAVLSDASTIVGYYVFYWTNENVITLEVVDPTFNSTELSTLIGPNSNIPLEIKIYN